MIDRKGGKRTITTGREYVRGPVWSRATGEIFFVAGKTAADRALRPASLSGRERVLRSAGGASLIIHDVAADGRLLLERATMGNDYAHGSLGPGRLRSDAQAIIGFCSTAADRLVLP